ncbi:MAG: hypothetical protein R3B71_03260 [Candidatus Gracilibacteria bacterium]
MNQNGDLLEVQVNIQDAPADFLGTSFHLNFHESKISRWDYKLGSVFGDEKPFVLVAEKDNALVTGMAFQSGNRNAIQDGNLITFSVQLEDGEDATLSFDYPVLSRYENGRQDVENVEWVGGTMDLEKIEGEKIVNEEVDEELTEENGKVFQANTLTYPPNGFESATVTDVYLFILGFGAFLCAMVGLGYLYYRYRKTVLGLGHGFVNFL